jgi:hypothetical protein
MNYFRKMREEREEARKPGGMYDRMAKYEGSPEYQAMLKRNGGVAPGGGSLGRGPFIGPRGGKYRINKNGRKSYDVP